MAGRVHTPGSSAALPVAALIVVSCVLCAGCIDGFSIPDFSGLLPLQAGGTGGKLNVYFFDVGQGDSAAILFGNTTVLIDAGDTGEGDTVVNDLRALGVTHIDLLVATHPHADHIGGMQEVLSAFSVGRVLDPGLPHTSALYENFLDTVDEKGIPFTVAERGETIDLDPSLRILVLSPPEERLGDDLNENSVVLRVSYGTFDILFTGDAGTEAETVMMGTGYPLDAEVLKAGHHGSTYSTGDDFLSRVGPAVSVISAGADNPYGHPHERTLDALDAAGVTVYRTDRDGTILVSSDGSSYSVSTTKGAGSIFTLAPPTTGGTGARTTATTAAATPSAGSTAAEPALTLPAFPAGNASLVSIAGVQFDAPGDDRQNLNGEWVRLANGGNESVILLGWTISDTTGTLYTFPPFILEPGRAVTVYTGSGWYNDTALFMGRTAPAWGNGGDTAILKDGAGTVIDRATG